jgi:Mg/Co/Ni transporter MgtE
MQRLLREPPATLLGGIIDSDISPLSPDSTLNEVALYLASYNLLAVPIVDSNERLLGAVTVDDVLDHLLPENWRQVESIKRESELN